MSVQVILQRHGPSSPQTPQGEESALPQQPEGASGMGALPAWLDAFLRRATKEREEARFRRGDQKDDGREGGQQATPPPKREAFSRAMEDVLQTALGSPSDEAGGTGEESAPKSPSGKSSGKRQAGGTWAKSGAARSPKRSAPADARARGGGSAAAAAAAAASSDRALLEAFERSVDALSMPPPRDATKRLAWEGWVAEERRLHVARTNEATLGAVLRAHGLALKPVKLLPALGPALGATKLSGAEAKRAVLEALKLEATRTKGKLDVSLKGPTKAAEKDEKLPSGGVDGGPGSTSGESGEGELVVTLRRSSLELGLAAACPHLPSRLPGALAAARPKAAVAALAQDKHERALVPNVVAAEDVGVSYDQVRGLRVLK